MSLLGNFVSNVQMLSLHACHDSRHKFKYDMEYVNNYAMRLYTFLTLLALVVGNTLWQFSFSCSNTAVLMNANTANLSTSDTVNCISCTLLGRVRLTVRISSSVSGSKKSCASSPPSSLSLLCCPSSLENAQSKVIHHQLGSDSEAIDKACGELSNLPIIP